MYLFKRGKGGSVAKKDEAEELRLRKFAKVCERIEPYYWV
tara:strand:+ start:278 stop:397 length:120 start_codon:yes stop_codon:yes gene_type:complete